MDPDSQMESTELLGLPKQASGLRAAEHSKLSQIRKQRRRRTSGAAGPCHAKLTSIQEFISVGLSEGYHGHLAQRSMKHRESNLEQLSFYRAVHTRSGRESRHHVDSFGT